MPGPGVVVTTGTRSGPPTAARFNAGQWFVAGMAERGPVNVSIVCRGMADFIQYYGNRVSYSPLYDQVKTFFGEGGTQCWVARVVGNNPTLGSLTINDQSASSGVATMAVNAASPGPWSSNLQVEVRAGLIPNTFRILVTLSGVVVVDQNNITSVASAVSKFVGSPYINVVDLGSPTAAPTNNPRVTAPTAISAGSDDANTVVAASYVAALNLFQPGYGDGAVSIPGQGSPVHAGITAHCVANNRVGILATVRGASKVDLISLSSTLTSSYTGLFAPWVSISDGGGGSRFLSPECFVAAKRAVAVKSDGVWRAPAGLNGQAVVVTGIDAEFSASDASDLDAARVSMIRTIANTVRLYGWRSTSTDTDNYALLTGQDVLNYLVVRAGDAMEEFVFNTIDSKGQLLSKVAAKLVGLVDPIAALGGLYGWSDAAGNEIDPGYAVIVDSSNNSTQSLSQNNLNATLNVRISPSAALISLLIQKVGLNASVS